MSNTLGYKIVLRYLLFSMILKYDVSIGRRALSTFYVILRRLYFINNHYRAFSIFVKLKHNMFTIVSNRCLLIPVHCVR